MDRNGWGPDGEPSGPQIANDQLQPLVLPHPSQT